MQDVERFDKMEFRHEPHNLTVQVSATMTIGELQQKLNEQGQILPVGPFSFNPTIEEILQFNLMGLYSDTYGLVKNWVLGMTISWQNNPIELGASVVKNVAGYDLYKLIIGSHEQLAPIETVLFKVIPQQKVKNVDSSPILDGCRAVVLPSQVKQVEAFINQHRGEYFSYPRLGIIDSTIEASSWKKFISTMDGKLLTLIRGIPQGIESEHTQLYEKLKSIFHQNESF